MAVATKFGYVEVGAGGVPVIAGTTMKVAELVVEHLGYGWGPAELHENHPYLSMAQVHSALGYYWDHKAEVDAYIAGDLERADALRTTLRLSPLQERLRSSEAA